jgi:hypothetical protein
VIEALKQPPAHASPEGGASGTGLGSLNPALALHHHQQRGSGMGMGMGMGGGSAAAAAAAALGTFQRIQYYCNIFCKQYIRFHRRSIHFRYSRCFDCYSKKMCGK